MILPARRDKAVAHSSGSTACVGPPGHYRCAGIGVGPANLSLASLLYSYPDMSNLFLEQKDDFGWHDGQQVPRASLQVSFCEDLVEPNIRRTLIARHVLTSDGISEATLREISQRSYVVLADQAARRARDAADRAQAAAQRARGPGPRDANDVWVRMPPVPLEYQGRELARRFFSTIAFWQGRPPGGQQILKTPRVHPQQRGRPTVGRCPRCRQVLAPLAGSTGAAAPCAPVAGQISTPAQRRTTS
jgi:L-lysine 6-monooxygenase (NADPH-requiring)